MDALTNNIVIIMNIIISYKNKTIKSKKLNDINLIC